MSIICPKCGKHMSEYGKQLSGTVTFRCDMKYTNGDLAGCGNLINMVSNFKIGDKVKIVNDNSWYGKHFTHKINEIAIVREISFTQGIISYALVNDEDSFAWVYESQLEKVYND